MSRNEPVVIELARAFATGAHAAIDQRRKYTNDPYIVHPQAVVRILTGTPRVTDHMIAAAWLHDVLEDTKVTTSQMKKVFDRTIVDMVVDLTDTSTPEDGNRAARKAIDRDRLAASSAQVQTIKVADLLDNTSSILAHDEDFARVYIPEKLALLEVLTKAENSIRTKAHREVEKALKQLGL